MEIEPQSKMPMLTDSMMIWMKTNQKRLKLYFLAKYFRVCDMSAKTSEVSPETIRYCEAPFLQSGLNFINILCTAFTLIGPKSAGIQSSSQYLFMLLGSKGAKAVHRMLMKLTPDGLLF